MTRAIVVLGLLVNGCGVSHSPVTVQDRAALEASVTACDRGDQQRGCDDARKTLAALRRDDRMNTYRQAL